MASTIDHVTTFGEPPQASRLRLNLIDSIASEDLAALLNSAAEFYRLHRLLDARESIATLEAFQFPAVLRIFSPLLAAESEYPTLIVSGLEIGTPNFIEWIGESKAIKALERMLQAAAAVVTIAAAGGGPPPPPPITIPVESPRTFKECMDDYDRVLDETLRVRELYMSSKINFTEYQQFSSEIAAMKAEALKGCKIVKRD